MKHKLAHDIIRFILALLVTAGASTWMMYSGATWEAITLLFLGAMVVFLLIYPIVREDIERRG